MRPRQRWLLGMMIALLASVVFLARSPAILYRLTGSQRQFNAAVSRGVPKGSTLARLESVVGPARLVAPPAWLTKAMQRQPADFPDGWREGDTFALYTFAQNATWYFQVRSGRLVNYNPAVLAEQPQDHVATLW